MKDKPFDANVNVIGGEVVVFWNDAHLVHNRPDVDRSEVRRRVSEMHEVTYIDETFTVSRGKFRFHSRSETYQPGEGEEVFFHGEHQVGTEFSNRVRYTRVKI